MTPHFVTHYDKNYEPFGLALLDSLKRHCSPCKITVLALDSECVPALESRGVAYWTLYEFIRSQVPELGLEKIRRERTHQHFCWTLEPVLCQWALRNSEFEQIVYVDSDVWFCGNIQRALAEIPEHAHVAATPHHFPKGKELRERTCGRYNVGVLWFRNSDVSRAVVSGWVKQTLAQCDSQTCGDQLYLDDWPKVIGEAFWEFRHPGLNVGPWQLAEISGEPPTIRGEPLLAYHFHELRPSNGGANRNVVNVNGKPYRLTYYDVADSTRAAVYEPYLMELAKHA